MDDKAAQDQADAANKDNGSEDGTADTADTPVAFGGLIEIEDIAQQPQAITSAMSAGLSDAPALLVVDSRAEGVRDLIANP
jgi:hypothetical protein